MSQPKVSPPILLLCHRSLSLKCLFVFTVPLKQHPMTTSGGHFYAESFSVTESTVGMAEGGYPSVYVVDTHATRPSVPPRLSQGQQRAGVGQTLLFLLVSVALCGMAIEACFIYRLYKPQSVSIKPSNFLWVCTCQQYFSNFILWFLINWESLGVFFVSLHFLLNPLNLTFIIRDDSHLTPYSHFHFSSLIF